MANDLDTMAAGSSKISNEADNKIRVVDDTVQGMHDTMEGVSDRARGANKMQVPVTEIEFSSIDGTQARPFLTTRPQYR